MDTHDYQNGQLQRVKDANVPVTVFWTANDTDARGHIISETLGNGLQTLRGFDSVTGWIDFIQSGAGGAIQNLNYQWNEVGSLRERQDVRQGLTETFFYDHLHRLTSTSGPDPISIGYDPRGNILSRSGGHLGIGNGHSITWTSYNLPNTITDAVGNNASQFFYGPDRSRFKQVASYGGTTEQTIYIGGLIEKVTLGTVTSWRHTISGASGPVAIYTRKSSGANEIHYLTKDPLGSVDSVTDASGNVEVRLSFAASGQRRNENGWSGNPTSADWTQITDTTRRGFTSHEMLDNLNLTHMNGRVYDQLIGQFISPDPFIDGPGSTQGWNRYGYVHNNPLSYVDPSGYFLEDLDWLDFDLDFGWGEFFGGGGHSHSCSGDESFCNRMNYLAAALGECGFNSHCLQDYRANHPPPGSDSDPAPTPPPEPVPPTLPPDLPPPRGLGNGGESTVSTVGGLGQGFLNAVPGAYYAGQSQIAWGDGRYLLSAGLYAAALGDAALGVLTLGESTALNGSVRAVATQGTATIYQYGTRHTSIAVRLGNEALHTEQIILANGSSTSIAEATTVGMTRALEVALPDGRAALAYQRSVLGTATGEYNLATNSCLTHCGDVLRAGGVSGVPSDTRGIMRWLRSVFGD